MAHHLGLTQILLLANLVVVSLLLCNFLKSANVSIQLIMQMESASIMPERKVTNNIRTCCDRPIDDGPPLSHNHSPIYSITTGIGGIGSTDSAGFYFVHIKEGECNFYEEGKLTHTTRGSGQKKLSFLIIRSIFLSVYISSTRLHKHPLKVKKTSSDPLSTLKPQFLVLCLS